MTQPPTPPTPDDPAASPRSNAYDAVPVSSPLRSPVESSEYAQTPYGPVPTDLYESPATTADADKAAAATAIRRWQIITTVACVAAAFVIIGFFVAGQKSASPAPTETITEVSTRTETETSRGTTKSRTSTATETTERTTTATDTATLTRTETVTTTKTVPGEAPPAVTCTVTDGGAPVCP